MSDQPRFIVVAASEMPSIAYKIMLAKAFGIYPKDEDIEFLVNPDVVRDPADVYVIDHHAIDYYGFKCQGREEY